MDLELLKTCSRCKRTKPQSEFYKNGRCKPCAKEETAKRNAALTPLQRREYALRTRYKLSHAEYETLLQLQLGRCAICLTDKPGGRKKHFHVDHDHATGVVRGLLCVKCNQGLGHFCEDAYVLERAVAYLRKKVGY